MIGRLPGRWSPGFCKINLVHVSRIYGIAIMKPLWYLAMTLGIDASPSRTMHKILFRYQHIIPAILIFVHHLILILSQLLHRRHSLLQLPHPLANPPPHFLSQLLVLSINDR